MLSYINALIFGLVEGITEFLPISSTAHLILTAKLLGYEQAEFLKSFEVIIQFGAIIAVLLLYWKSFLNKEILKRLFVAFIPSGILGFILYKLVRNLLGDIRVVLWALLIGGILIIAFEKLFKSKDDEEQTVEAITYKQSLFIGIFQAVAMIPGVSRSAATILGGLLLGVKRKAIVEFSFLLAV